MTELEATRLKLKCLEMVEGTKLKWWEAIRIFYFPKNKYDYFSAPIKFTSVLKDYNLALGIIEGKPVWEGDELYTKEGAAFIVRADTGFCPSAVSWNPPKPKTVMVELLVEDADEWAKQKTYVETHTRSLRLFAACHKALENLK